ncbi:MAG: HlyD family efflux transporter periplasmic adaptor subunit [Pirellulaceae bacterium]|nr:HlyD family efflux transporter periplasmic adaptor subunit [Pirellulaceae bacterium]
MTTLAESLISSTSRPLTLRMRPDLSAKRHRYHGQTFWVVKEPVGLSYFRFHEEEYAILCMLDGMSSLDQIKEQFEQQFAPQKITFHDLLQFVGMLHRSGLVISEATGQGHQLRKRRDEKKWRELMGKLANVFALRFRGVDPERFFNAIYPYTGWFFRWYTVLCVMLLGLAALTLVGVQFDEFSRRLPAFHEFFGPKNWFYLAITMGVVKVLHEFGHGLSCKHFGGECHELGGMLLVFTPALYCNVSDSWMLPNKWHRAAIGAAGMYVELFLASVATFLWWFSTPGLFNHICLSVMFICSVSTVVFNGNPLLRFDGYYILMDVLEIPNLRQKSTEITRRFFVWLCLGIEQPENPFLPQQYQWAFALYTIAAVVYRWLVVFSILFFLNSIFEPYGLKIIGQLIGLTGFFGLIVQPIIELSKFFYTPGRMNKMKKERLVATVAVVAAAILVVLFLPLPFSVKCTFEVQPKGAQQVFSPHPGQITAVAYRPGDQVRQGETIMTLESPDLEFELAELKGRLDEATQVYRSLLDQRFSDPAAVDQLQVAQELRDTAQKQYDDKKAEFDRLTIKAARDGTILPPPPKQDKQAQMSGSLRGWVGTPFDKKNLGALVAPTDLICQIGDPSVLEAVLVIDQTYIDLVREGQPVRVLLESNTHRAFDTTIEKIAATDLEAISRGASTLAGGRLEAKTDPASGITKPLNTSYQASAPLPAETGRLQVGMQGQARIYTGWQPLGRRLFRFVAKTFHFDL